MSITKTPLSIAKRNLEQTVEISTPIFNSNILETPTPTIKSLETIQNSNLELTTISKPTIFINLPALTNTEAPKVQTTTTIILTQNVQLTSTEVPKIKETSTKIPKVILPTLTPTFTETSTKIPTSTPFILEEPISTGFPTLTPTFTKEPTNTPFPTSTPFILETPVSTSEPTFTETSTEVPTTLPTDTPTFTETSTFTSTPIPTNTATNTPCVISGSNFGKQRRIRWDTTNSGVPAGNPSPNLNSSFNSTDIYGLPFRSSTPNSDVFLNGASWTGGVSSGAATIQEIWIIAPVGFNNIKLNVANYGGTSTVGGYVGTSRSSATQQWWNTNNGNLKNFDITNYPTVCGQHIIYMRSYLADGYNVGGIAFYWDIGSGSVVIPNSNIFGTQIQ